MSYSRPGYSNRQQQYGGYANAPYATQSQPQSPTYGHHQAQYHDPHGQYQQDSFGDPYGNTHYEGQDAYNQYGQQNPYGDYEEQYHGENVNGGGWGEHHEQYEQSGWDQGQHIDMGHHQGQSNAGQGRHHYNDSGHDTQSQRSRQQHSSAQSQYSQISQGSQNSQHSQPQDPRRLRLKRESQRALMRRQSPTELPFDNPFPLFPTKKTKERDGKSPEPTADFKKPWADAKPKTSLDSARPRLDTLMEHPSLDLPRPSTAEGIRSKGQEGFGSRGIEKASSPLAPQPISSRAKLSKSPPPAQSPPPPKSPPPTHNAPNAQTPSPPRGDPPKGALPWPTTRQPSNPTAQHALSIDSVATSSPNKSQGQGPNDFSASSRTIPRNPPHSASTARELGPDSPTYVPPRPTTAQEPRPSNNFSRPKPAPRQHSDGPTSSAPPAVAPVEASPPQQQKTSNRSKHDTLHEFYDTYYYSKRRDPRNQRKLDREAEIEASMPNFDDPTGSQAEPQKRGSYDQLMGSNGPYSAPVGGDAAPNALKAGYGNFDVGGDPNRQRAMQNLPDRTMTPQARGATPMSAGPHRAGSVPPEHAFQRGQNSVSGPHSRYPGGPAPGRPLQRAATEQGTITHPSQQQQRMQMQHQASLGGRAQRPQFGQSEQSNPDALPQHPAPYRPGLAQAREGQTGNKPPPPIRTYPNANQSFPPSLQSPVRAPSTGPQGGLQRYGSQQEHPQQQRQQMQQAPQPPQQQQQQQQQQKKPPITQAELDRMRQHNLRSPEDYASRLAYAKALIEASSVLVPNSDTRTRVKAREKFINDALKEVKKLGQAGYPDAMFFLADSYGSGHLGLDPDPKEAFQLYQQAAKAGHAQAAYRTAVCCEMGGDEGGGTRKDPLKAVQWYRRAAALGDSAGMYKLGMITLRGLLGQKPDLSEGMRWLTRAAEKASPEEPHSLHELGVLYERPIPGQDKIIADPRYAFELFRQAATYGLKASQFKLGEAYEYGLLGCPIDARNSIAWYTKAAAQGDHQAELALSGWYLTGSEGILEQSDTEAYLWARKASMANPPQPKAMFAMGYFTEIGIGCPRSLDEAKRWYGRAASCGYPKAQQKLDDLRRAGPKAPPKGRERLSRSNQQKMENECSIM